MADRVYASATLLNIIVIIFVNLGFLAGFLLGGSVADVAGYLTAFLVVVGLEIAIALVALPAVRRLTRKDTVAGVA